MYGGAEQSGAFPVPRSSVHGGYGLDSPVRIDVNMTMNVPYPYPPTSVAYPTQPPPFHHHPPPFAGYPVYPPHTYTVPFIPPESADFPTQHFSLPPPALHQFAPLPHTRGPPYPGYEEPAELPEGGGGGYFEAHYARADAYIPNSSALRLPEPPPSLHFEAAVRKGEGGANGGGVSEVGTPADNEEDLKPLTLGRGRGRKTNAIRKYQCPQCLKQYCRRSTLKAHLRFHNGERPYACRDCGKTFSQAANLTAHRRVHTGEKPFSCPVCRRPFSQSSSLVTHKRTHTGERPYSCHHCGKAFTDSSTLTKHLRTHTGVKPYECHLCTLTFSQSGNLNRHMKTHYAPPTADL